MNKLPATVLAGVVLAAPTSAWAHGDHEGLHGFVHVLASSGHYGLILLGLAGTALFGRKVVHRLAVRRADARKDAD